METISPQASPTGSISPPVTPFSIALPHTYALPPIKTLPTWNRNRFKRDDKTRSIHKNKNIKVELIGHIGKLENCTQTSPLEKWKSSSLERIPTAPSEKVLTPTRGSANRKTDSSINRLKKTYDKKIIFLETTHQEVLSNLHHELEMMKSQNRDLKFQLVMAGDGSSSNHHEREEKVHNTHHRSDVEETVLLKGEIKDLKRLLAEADSKNIQLTRLVEQLKQRSLNSRLSSGSHTKTASHNSLKKNSSVKVKHEDNKGEVKKEKEKQTEDLLSDEKDIYVQNRDSFVVFPRLDQGANKSAPITSTTIYRRTQEPISLPMLQGTPANRNMAFRQKRARANHVRRQRSNKNVTLMTATATTSNR